MRGFANAALAVVMGVVGVNTRLINSFVKFLTLPKDVTRLRPKPPRCERFTSFDRIEEMSGTDPPVKIA